MTTQYGQHFVSCHTVIQQGNMSTHCIIATLITIITWLAVESEQWCVLFFDQPQANIVFWKVYAYGWLFVCMYICLSFCTQTSKNFTYQEQPVCKKWRPQRIYIKLKRQVSLGYMPCRGIKELKNNEVTS